MRNQGMSFHDRRQEELEMDNLLEAYGFSAAAIPGSKSPNERQNQSHHMKGGPFEPVRQDQQRRGSNNQYFNTTLKMGAQGFQETDYTPTELQESGHFRGMDMDLFPDLKSVHGVNSDVFNENKPRTFSRSPQKAPPRPNQMRNPPRPAPRPADNDKNDGTHGFSIESILDPKASSTVSAYNVTMRIKYKTELGESLCIIGDLEELGNWSNFRCKMRWTEGHIWEISDLVLKKPQFLYKYVVLQHDQPSQWERGENRVADLRVSPEQSPDADILNQVLMSNTGNNKRNAAAKNVEIFDEWEAFTVRMQVFVPYALRDSESIHISCSLPGMGTKQQPLKLQLSRKQQNPMILDSITCKYGRRDLKSWECVVKLNSYDERMKKLPLEVSYEYYIMDSKTKRLEPERASYGARRKFRIQKPETYCDTMTMVASAGVLNRQDLLKTWIINGQITVQDGNFLGKDFSMTKIDDTGLWFGSFPADPNDIQRVRQNGIRTIVNVQTEAELALREIDIKKIQSTCQQLQIQFIRQPLKENDEGEYAFDLFKICQRINQTIEAEKKGPLLVHCTSGVTRSPTVALAYLCIFKKIQDWDNPTAFSNYLSGLNPKIYPNLAVVERTIQNNLNFIDKQQFQGEMKTSRSSNRLPTQEVPLTRNVLGSERSFNQKSNANISQRNLAQQSKEQDLNYETSSEKDTVQNRQGSSQEEAPPKERKSQNPLKVPRSPRRSEARSQAHRSQSSAPWDQEDDDGDDDDEFQPSHAGKRSQGSRHGSDFGNKSRASAPWEREDEASGSQSDNEIIKLIEKAEQSVPSVSSSFKEQPARSNANRSASQAFPDQSKYQNRLPIKPFYTNPKISQAAKQQHDKAYSKIRGAEPAEVQSAAKIEPEIAAPVEIEPERAAMPVAKASAPEVKASIEPVAEVKPTNLDVPQFKKSLEPSSSVRSLQRMDDIQEKYKELQQELLKQKEMNEALIKEQEQKQKIAMDLAEAEKQAKEFKEVLEANQAKTDQIYLQIDALKTEKQQIMKEMEEERMKQSELHRQQEEKERLHQENTKKLVKRINMVEVERKVAKDLEKKLQEQLQEKQKELLKIQTQSDSFAHQLKEQQEKLLHDKESQMNEQLTQKEREMKQMAVQLEKTMKEQLQRKQEELIALKEDKEREVEFLKLKQEQTIQNKEIWLNQQLYNKEREVKETLDVEISKQQEVIQKQREENQRKERELNETIQKMKQDMTQQQYEYKLKEAQIQERQRQLVQMKEDELLAQLKRQQEEFKVKTEEQQQREKQLLEAHAREIQEKEKGMKDEINRTLRELEVQKKTQAASEEKLVEKQNELLRQQEESMSSLASQQQKAMLESLRERLEEQYKQDLEQRLRQQQMQAEELINEYEQKQQIEIQRLQEMSMKEQEETQQMMEELLEQKEREKIAAEQQARERIQQEQEIRSQMSAQSSLYLETLKEQLKREQSEKLEIRRLSEEAKVLYERQLQQEKEKIQREKEELEKRMKEKEQADAAEIERLRKAEQKLKELQEERKKRRKEKKEKLKKDEQSTKTDQFQDELASQSTFAQVKPEQKLEKSLLIEEASDSLRPITLKNQRVLQPTAQADSAHKGFDLVQGLFLDDGSSAASAAQPKPEKKEIKEPAPIVIQEVPELIEGKNPAKAPVVVKSKPPTSPAEPSKAMDEDFGKNSAPKIIESRLRPDEVKCGTQPAKLRLESIRRDDATLIQIKQPENINYEGQKSNKDESVSVIEEKQDKETPRQREGNDPKSQEQVQKANEQDEEDPQLEFADRQEDSEQGPKNTQLDETLQLTQKTHRESPYYKVGNGETRHDDTQEEKELIDQINGKVDKPEKAETTLSKCSSAMSDKRPLLAQLDQIAQKKRLARLRGISPVNQNPQRADPPQILPPEEVLPMIDQKPVVQKSAPPIEKKVEAPIAPLIEQVEEAPPQVTQPKAQAVKAAKPVEETPAKPIETEVSEELSQMRQKEQDLLKRLELAEEKERQVAQKAAEEAQLKLQKEKEAEEAQKKLQELEKSKAQEMSDIQKKIQEEVQEAIMRQVTNMQKEREEEMKRKEKEIEQLRQEVDEERSRKLEVEKKMAEETEKAREEERQKFKEQESKRIEKEQMERLLQEEMADDVDEQMLMMEEEQEWEQIEREKKEREKQWKQYEKEKDEHLKSLQNSQVQTERMRQELKQLEENKKNRDLVDSAVARIAGEMIICHIENTIQQIYDAEIQKYLNQNDTEKVDEDSNSEENLLQQIEQERKMVEEQRKKIQNFIDNEKQDTEQRQRLSLVEQEQQNLLQQKKIQEEQRLLEEKIRNLEIQKQIHDLNMQREQLQLQNLPVDTSDQKKKETDAPAEVMVPVFAEEPQPPSKSGEKEVKKRRTALERKRSGFQSPDKANNEDRGSGTRPNASVKKHRDMLTEIANIRPDYNGESINPFDLAGSCISGPSNPSRAKQEHDELPIDPDDLASRNNKRHQNNGSQPVGDKNWTNDGANRSQDFDEFGIARTLSMQKKKSINNLDQFEQASSEDSGDNYKQSPSNAQSTPSLGKFPINEQVQEQPTINLVIQQDDHDPFAQDPGVPAYATMTNKTPNNPRSKAPKLQDVHDSFEGVEPEQIFQQDRPPIIFVPRKNNKVDQMIANVIAKHDLRVPVAPIRPGLYLIGANRANVDCKFEQAIVKVGAGTQKLEPYLLKNEMPQRNKLIDLMNKSGKDLRWVVSQLKEGKQIKTAEFKDLVVKRQGSGTLFSVADNESVANSRHSRVNSRGKKKLDRSDMLYSAGHGSQASNSPTMRQARQQAQNRVRQFDQLQAPGRAPNPKDSFISSAESRTGAQANELGRSFKNPKTKGIQLYPG